MMVMMFGTEANFISNDRKLQFHTQILLKVLCIKISGPSGHSYSLSHWHHSQGSAFWRQSCRTLALLATTSHWSHFLWTVTLLSQASTGPLQFGITCKHAPCHLPRSLIRGCCGSSLVSSQQAVNYPSITTFWVKLSKLFFILLMVHPSRP